MNEEEEELNRAFSSSSATVMGVHKPGAPRPGPWPRVRVLRFYMGTAQVKKEEEELNRAFGSSGATVMGVQKPGAPRPGATAADLAEKKMVTVMLFGNAHEIEVAQRMIAEAIDNKARGRCGYIYQFDARLPFP